MKRSQNTQVNIAIPTAWKEQLDAIARIESVEAEKVITFQELMRQAIKEKFQLDEVKDDPDHEK